MNLILGRSYHQWSDCETETLRSYFRSWVEDVSQSGAKGRLPGKTKWTSDLLICIQ